ncbi:MAG: DUF2867 domain-containing protein [Desulfuromonadaceae bacterium]|nr:DUF2867 domain-containing protein [Desulfuromonadaceae bacterium]MDD5105696.1 DUF2867 domain-containing protein [Desulfuromonadaceae bacterium]
MPALTNTSINKTSLPSASILHTPDQRSDYVDSYSSVIEQHGQNLAIDEVAKAFFTSGPEWVESLFALRNRIVGVFGLKTGGAGNRQQLHDNFTCNVGDKLGLFKVFAKNEQEVILGEDDKHLNFRVSLFMGDSNNEHDKELIISTVVTFHNWLGRLYFLPVKQFHRMIVPAMLKGVVTQLQR